MKALIFSDSHRHYNSIDEVISSHPDVSLIIHAGDVQKDVEEIEIDYPHLPCACVLGNNDFYAKGVPFDRVFVFGGKKIFLTHGHNYAVKVSPHRVIAEARRHGADICIFGHTHIPYLENLDGLWVVNPGPAKYGYALLTIKYDKVSVELKSL